MSQKKDICEMDSCTDEVGHPTLGLCKACYAWFWYHKNILTVKESLEYYKKQDRINARIDTVQRTAKVRPIKKRKAA